MVFLFSSGCFREKTEKPIPLTENSCKIRRGNYLIALSHFVSFFYSLRILSWSLTCRICPRLLEAVKTQIIRTAKSVLLNPQRAAVKIRGLNIFNYNIQREKRDNERKEEIQNTIKKPKFNAMIKKKWKINYLWKSR